MKKRFLAFGFILFSLFNYAYSQTADTAYTPYYCDFEDSLENAQWIVTTPNLGYRWFIGAAAGNGGNGLYISDDGGVTNSVHSVANPVVKWAYRDVYIDSSYSTYQLSFDYRGNENPSANTYTKVFVGPPATPVGSNTPAGATQVGTTLGQCPDWTRHSFTVNFTQTGVQRIYFMWYCYMHKRPVPPAAVDNISLVGITCGTPSQLTVDTIFGNNAQLSWNAPSFPGTPSSYIVAYKSEWDSTFTEVVVTDTSCFLQDLHPASSYVCMVRAVCEDTLLGEWCTQVHFSTERIRASFPLHCDFEEGWENNCWLFYNQTYGTIFPNRWYIGEATHNGGTHAAYISQDGGATNTYTNTFSSSWAYREIFLDPAYLEYELSFDVQCAGRGYNEDYTELCLGAPDIPTSASQPSNMTSITDRLYNKPSWTHCYFTLDSTWAGEHRLYLYWHNTTYTPNNPAAGYDNISIVGVTCSRPKNLSSFVADTSATLTWSHGTCGTPVSYTLAYRRDCDSTFTEITVTDNEHTLTGLTPLSEFVWKVRANCTESDTGNWSVEKHFTTLKTVGMVPYSCDFEDTVENTRWYLQTQSINGWYIGSAVNNGGGHSLYISSDSGATNSYQNSTFTHVWAYRDIYFPQEYGEYILSFDFKCLGTSESETMSVYLGTPETPEYNLPESMTVASGLWGDTVWTHKEYLIRHTKSGLQRLYLSWKSWDYGPNNPPAAVDNITITGVTCGQPFNLTVTTTDTNALLSWDAGNSIMPESFTVAYKRTEDSDFTEVTVTDTVLSLIGLDLSTNYQWKVRSNCSATDTSAWSDLNSFLTITPLPYFCDFEDADENAHWETTVISGNNQWFIGNAVSNGGSSSIYISQDNGLTNTFDINSTSQSGAYRDIFFDPEYKEYLLSFDVRCQGGDLSRAAVLLGSPTDFDNDAIQLGNEISGLPEWTHYEYILDSTFAGNRRLYLNWYNIYYSYFSPGENPPAAFDNISISGVSCSKPVSLTMSDIGLHSATVSWSSGNAGAAASYTVAYRRSIDTAFAEVTVSDTTLQFTDLQSGSHYFWKVRANCQENEMSDWSAGKEFYTFAELPYSCGFEIPEESDLWALHYQPMYAFSYNIDNRWTIGEATHCTGNSAMYISNDGGLSNTYATNYGGTAWACLNLYLDPAYPEYQISFDFKGVGEQGQDYMRVYCGDPFFSDDPTVFPNNLEQVGSDLNLTEEWTTYTFTLDSTYAGFKQLYLCWTNNYDYGENPPAAVDNITVVGSHCGIPTNMSQQATDSTALLRWSASLGVPESYILAYKKTADSVFTEINTTDTFLLLTSLLPLTDYVWKVKAVCDDSTQSLWSNLLGFTTTQPLAHLPYLCSFNNPSENSHWALANGSAENQWIIGNATGYGDSNALYISNDSGTTNAYTLTSTSSVWAYRDVYFDENHLAYQLSFDYKGMGQNSTDYMKVFVGTPSVPSGTAAPEGAVQLGEPLFDVNDWTHYSYVLDSTHTGVQRIYFQWVNNNSTGVQPPAAVDNLAISGLTCVTPSDPMVSDMTANTVTLSWSPNPLSQAASYTVSLQQAGSTATTEYTATDTFLTISGLTPSMAYFCKVRANCSANDHSGWSSDLLVQMPAALPYYCDFEDAQERNAWQMVNGTYTNKWHVGNAVNYGGEYSLYVSNNGGDSHAYSYYNSYVWTYRDIYFDPSDSAFTLTFDILGAGGTSSQYSAYTNVYIGEPTVPNGSTIPAGLTELETGLCGMSEWTTKTYTLDYTHAGLQRLYFFWRNTGYTVANPPTAIDNITIDGTPCSHIPSDLTAQVIDTMATLLWTLPDGSADYYTIAYKAQSDTDYTYITSQDEQFPLGNLTPATPYFWKVRAHCTANDYSSWSAEATFTTAVSTAHLPYLCDFEDSEESSRWILVNGSYTNKWHIGSAVNNGGTNSLYVSNDNGANNAYTVNSLSFVWAYRDFYFTPGYPNYQLSFDIRSFGELYNGHPYDYVRVFLGPPVTPPEHTYNGTHIPDGATQLGGDFLSDSLWHTESFTVDSSHAGPQRLYFLWINDSSYGTNPPGAVDNIQVSVSGCPMPVQTTAVNILDDAALLTWQSDADTFVVAYKSLNDTAFTEMVTTDQSWQLQGLQPTTTYVWKVKSLCSDGEASLWTTASAFQTLDFLGRIPYAHGFEDTLENNYWHIQPYHGNTSWYIDNAVHQSGNNALYISSDGGATNSFVNTNIWYCWAYRDFYFDPEYSGYEISFDYRVAGAADFAGMRVFIGPPATPNYNYVPAEAVQIGDDFYGHPTWTHFTYTADTTFQGVKRLYFLWTHDWGVGSNPPAAVDNVSIQGGHCGIPVHIAVDSVTAHSITVHFTPSSPTDSIWEAAVVPSGSTINLSQLVTLTDTFYTFQNLVNNTTYDLYFRASCGNGEYSYWSQPITQRTDCGYISSLPYIENFDTYGTADFPWCWQRLNTATGSVPYIDLFTPGHYNHTYSSPGMMTFPSGNNSIVILPEIDPGIPINELQITFQYKTYDPATIIIVGVMSDPEDASTFTPVDTVQHDYHQVQHWAEKKVHLHNYTGNGHFIALRGSGNIDNVLLEQLSCPLPHDINVTGITDHSADIDWIAEGGETSWQVVVQLHELPLTQASPITVTSKPYHIDNLEFGKWYDVYVKADCGNGENSGWSMPKSFTTDCATITHLPFIEDFENYFQPWYFNEFARPRCWSFPHTDWAYPDVFFPENANIQETHYYVGNSHSLWFRTENSGAMLMAVMPRLDMELHDVRASFKMLAESEYSGSLEVGVLNSTGDESSFELVRTIEAGEITGSWADVVVDFDSTAISGQGNYIAFRYHPWSTNWYMWMDDLELSYIHPSDTDSTGIVPHSLDRLAKVFPNPTSDEITVLLESSPIRDVELLDVYGKLLARVPVNDYRANLDLSPFAPGVYFVRVTTEQGTATKRVVKR